MGPLRVLRQNEGAAPLAQAVVIGVTSTVLVAGLAFVATRTARAPEVKGRLSAQPAPEAAAPSEITTTTTTTTTAGGLTVGTQAAAPRPGRAVVTTDKAALVPGGGVPAVQKGRFVNLAEGIWADRFNIGGTAPLQGALATYAEQGVAGYESRVRYINDKGGINGRKANLIYYDTQGQCQQALQGTKRLIEVDKLFIYGGTDQVGCVADYLLDHGVPLIGDLGLHRKSFEYPNIFPIGPGPYHAGHIQAKYVTQYPGIGAKSVGIIQLSDDFLGPPDELLADSIKAFEFYGAKVPATAKMSFSDSDCSQQLQTMRSANVDFVVLPTTFNQALLCVTQATKTLLYKPPKGWGGTGLGVKFFADNIPRDAEPVYAGQLFDPVHTNSAGMKEYVSILNRYHPEVDLTSFVTQNYYLAAKLDIYLTEVCGEAPTRRCVVDTANSLTNWDTGLGLQLTYRPNNHTPTLKAHTLTLKDKDWKYLYEVDRSSPVWWEDLDIPPGGGPKKITGH